MADEPSTLNLKILSPSTEVEGGVSFTDLPTTTTIKELRRRIQDAVPSKPAPERMRLIYRGRVVANDADTLGNVFGAENIHESKDQSLHMVIRELPPSSSASSSPGPRSSTAPPNPFRPAQAPAAASPLQTNPFRAVPQARPASQPQVAPQPHHHHHHPHLHHPHVAGAPNAFPIPLPPVVQQQLAQTLAMAQNAQLNNGQPLPTQDQPQSERNPVPENVAQPPPMGLPPLPGFAAPADGRAVRQEGIGPTGERWSVTYSSTTIPNQPPQPMIARTFMPPTFALPPRPTGSPAPTEAIDRLLPRMRVILQSARQEMENVRLLLQPSGQQTAQSAPFPSTSPPAWRLERIRLHVQTMAQNLNLVERGLHVIAADASMTNNPDVVALRQSATELRGHLEDLSRTMGQQGAVSAGTQGGLTTAVPAPSPPSQAAGSAAMPTLPSEAPQELFLLSSPQGPVGLLFDQRGTYMTAPMVQTLPFQTFTNQFAQNRQLIAGLGQHMAQSSQLHAQNAQSSNASQPQLANLQPTPTQPAGQRQEQAHVQDHAQAQPQNQAANQDANANANQPPNPAGDNDRVGNIAGHLWLLFKLACFVYFFSGTGWYKSILLGLIAGGVYLAQLGMFEEQFRVIRQHLEAVLPVGALAERAAQPVRPAQPGRNMTPEEAARRLLQQQQDQRVGWLRDGVRTVERSLAIFVASLWPGIGERMVHAQEERIRAERAAEEERQRQAEEEQKKREDEAGEQDEKKGEPTSAVEEPAEGSSAKGKERAEVAPIEDS
ncbi:hypothetical protein HBI18_170610 [Parastagonospora nodorum]|nr:hypothetical protein HBI18_170610 [Parastagonospora nodorum]